MPQQNNPQKIGFFLINQYGGRGGVENVLRLLTHYLQQQGIESSLLYTDIPVHPEFLDDFPHTLAIQKTPTPNKFPWTYLPRKVQYHLHKKCLRKLIHHELTNKIAPLQLDTLVIINFPTNFIKCNDLILHYKKHHNVKIFSWLHGSLGDLSSGELEYIKRTLPIFDGHLAICKGIQTQLQKLLGVQSQLTYNPVQDAPLVRRNIHKLLYIGRIDENKRVKQLLEVVAQLKGEWSLDIIGSTGSIVEDQKFIRGIHELGISSHVHFHGWHSAPWELIHEAGTLLLNSQQEGFPLILIEAMIRGIPCISSNCPTGPNEIIQPGINGWLYPVDEPETALTILQEIITQKRLLPSPTTVRDTAKKFLIQPVANNFLTALQQSSPK